MVIIISAPFLATPSLMTIGSDFSSNLLNYEKPRKRVNMHTIPLFISLILIMVICGAIKQTPIIVIAYVKMAISL